MFIKKKKDQGLNSYYDSNATIVKIQEQYKAKEVIGTIKVKKVVMSMHNGGYIYYFIYSDGFNSLTIPVEKEIFDTLGVGDFISICYNDYIKKWENKEVEK